LRSMPELMIMIKGMVAATRSVIFTLLLLIIIMYVFGIMFTQLCMDTEIGEKYFASIPESMYTLTVTGTFLDNLTVVVNEIGRESKIYAALFFLFILLAALTVLNMLIGVLCEVVSGVAACEREEMILSFVKGQMKTVMNEIDEDGDGEVSRAEFVKILENKKAVLALVEVGVDPAGLVDFADQIFTDEDEDQDSPEGNEIALSFEEFMDVILQFRGGNAATVKDMVDMRKFITKRFKAFEDKLTGQGRPRRSSSRKSVRRISLAPCSLPPSDPCSQRTSLQEPSGASLLQGFSMKDLKSAMSRLEACVTTVVNTVNESIGGLPPSTPSTGASDGCKQADGSASHLQALPGVPGVADSNQRASPPTCRDTSEFTEEHQGRMQRLKEFGRETLLEIQRVRKVLPLGTPLGRHGIRPDDVTQSISAATMSTLTSSGGEVDQVMLKNFRVWMSRMEDFLLSQFLEVLESKPLPPLPPDHPPPATSGYACTGQARARSDPRDVASLRGVGDMSEVDLAAMARLFLQRLDELQKIREELP